MICHSSSRRGVLCNFPHPFDSQTVLSWFMSCVSPSPLVPGKSHPRLFRFPLHSACVLLCPQESLFSLHHHDPPLRSSSLQLLQATHSQLRMQSWDTQIRRNIMCLSFWVSATSFSIVFSSSSHLPANLMILFFLEVSNIPCVYGPHL